MSLPLVCVFVSCLTHENSVKCQRMLWCSFNRCMLLYSKLSNVVDVLSLLLLCPLSLLLACNLTIICALRMRLCVRVVMLSFFTLRYVFFPRLSDHTRTHTHTQTKQQKRKQIAPVYWKNDLENVQFISLLFYNDCQFVAKHLAALHVQYQYVFLFVCLFCSFVCLFV